MKTSFKQLKEAEQSFNRILQAPMDPKLSYRMSKVANKIIDIMETIEKYRRELIRKYGEKKENEIISVPDKNMKAFQDEWEAYLEKEFDFEIQLIPYECIEQGGVKLSAIDWALIGNFINTPAGMK